MIVKLPIPVIALLVLYATAAPAQQTKPPRPTVTLLEKQMDPFGHPRPPHGAKGVPVRTSLYFEMGLEQAKPDDRVSTPTLSVTLQAVGQEPARIVIRLRHPDGKPMQSVTVQGKPHKDFNPAKETVMLAPSAESITVRAEY